MYSPAWKSGVLLVARVSSVLLAAIKAQSSGFSFWLLSETGSAIICVVSRRAILETLIFEIPAAVKGAAGWLARIG